MTKIGHTSIALIDDLYCPFDVVKEPLGPRGGMRVVSKFWGYGYSTHAAAVQAIARTEDSGVTPPGVPLNPDNGKRI